MWKFPTSTMVSRSTGVWTGNGMMLIENFPQGSTAAPCWDGWPLGNRRLTAGKIIELDGAETQVIGAPAVTIISNDAIFSIVNQPFGATPMTSWKPPIKVHGGFPCYVWLPEGGQTWGPVTNFLSSLFRHVENSSSKTMPDFGTGRKLWPQISDQWMQSSVWAVGSNWPIPNVAKYIFLLVTSLSNHRFNWFFIAMILIGWIVVRYPQNRG